MRKFFECWNALSEEKKSNAVAVGLRVFALIFFFFLVVHSLPSRAGGGMGSFAGATEMTQIMNNAELAMQSVQQELQSIELIEQTYLARLQQLKASIGQYTAPFQKAYDAYQKVKATQEKLLALKSNLGRLDEALEIRFKQFGASNLSWKDWVSRESQLIAAGNQRAISQASVNHQVLQSTQDAMQAYQQAANAMEASTGTHQATRVLGSQLTLLGGDLNKLITLTAAANTAKALEVQDKAIDREQSRQAIEEMRKKQSELDKKRRAELEQRLKDQPANPLK